MIDGTSRRWPRSGCHVRGLHVPRLVSWGRRQRGRGLFTGLAGLFRRTVHVAVEVRHLFPDLLLERGALPARRPSPSRLLVLRVSPAPCGRSPRPSPSSSPCRPGSPDCARATPPRRAPAPRAPRQSQRLVPPHLTPTSANTTEPDHRALRDTRGSKSPPLYTAAGLVRITLRKVRRRALQSPCERLRAFDIGLRRRRDRDPAPARAQPGNLTGLIVFRRRSRVSAGFGMCV